MRGGLQITADGERRTKGSARLNSKNSNSNFPKARRRLEETYNKQGAITVKQNATGTDNALNLERLAAKHTHARRPIAIPFQSGLPLSRLFQPRTPQARGSPSYRAVHDLLDVTRSA